METWQQLQEKQDAIMLAMVQKQRLMEQQARLQQQTRDLVGEIQDYDEQLMTLYSRITDKTETSLINRILNWNGRLDDRLEKAEEEAGVLELKRGELVQIRQDLEADYEVAKVKHEALGTMASLEQGYAQIIEQKKHWVEHYAQDKATHLHELDDERVLAQRLLIEIREAITVGHKAMELLEQVQSKLHTAEGYSSWDTFLGGGMFVTHLKHNALNDSKGVLHQAQIALQRFQNELLDIEEISTRSLQVHTGDFVKFADYFFDDIFSAWSVHTKIATARQQVRSVSDTVANNLLQLESKITLVEAKLANIENEYNAMLGI